MDKREIFNQHISEKYNGIDKIIADDKYTEEDVRSFLRFQESNRPANVKGYDNWQKLMGIADKIKRVGVNGVLMREDVEGTYKSVEDDERGHLIKYIVVQTRYGDIYVLNGRSVDYIR